MAAGTSPGNILPSTVSDDDADEGLEGYDLTYPIFKGHGLLA